MYSYTQIESFSLIVTKIIIRISYNRVHTYTYIKAHSDGTTFDEPHSCGAKK